MEPDDKNHLCDTCQLQGHKYKCPGCCRKSCSLECVKRHKVEFDCSGRRCKTAFVKLSNFNDNRLHSDYYFLEDVSRYIDSAHRGRMVITGEQRDSHRVTQQIHWLRVHADRRSVKLLSLSPGMTKHRMNRSKTVRSKNGVWSIQWTVRLLFQDTDVDHLEHNVPEGIVLRDLLNRFVHPTDSDPILRHRLRSYARDGDVSSLQVYLKNEASLKSSKDVLDLSKTLCDNLHSKTVVEFPTLIIEKDGDTDTPSAEHSPMSDTTPASESLTEVASTPPATESPTEVASDWSDYEEGEVKDSVSSLQLIAHEYGDDD